MYVPASNRVVSLNYVACAAEANVRFRDHGVITIHSIKCDICYIFLCTD